MFQDRLSDSLPFFVWQLLLQVPVLIVYLVGLVLALRLHRRAPTACTLTAIATGLLLLMAVGHVALMQFLISHADPGPAPRWLFSASAFVVNLVRAAAMGLLLAAVFIGRRTPAIFTLEPAEPLRGTDQLAITNRPAH